MQLFDCKYIRSHLTAQVFLSFFANFNFLAVLICKETIEYSFTPPLRMY